MAKLDKAVHDTHTEEKIRYIFMVLSPEEDSKKHLETLSEIAKFIMQEKKLKDLEEASDTDELIKVFYPE